MYGVYDYGVVTRTRTRARTHTHTHTRIRAEAYTTCDNLPQRHFSICNRIIAAMFEILILLTSLRVR